jgi:hypothetical protein
MDPEEIGYERVNCSRVVEGRVPWQVLENTAMILWVPCEAGNF